ncbi:MAG: GTPase RsgA, partial [Sutterella sp.]
MPKSAKRSSAPSRELLPGLVIASHGRHYKVLIESGEVLEAHRRGKRGDVCVGDHVQCTPPDSGVAAIEVVEERRNLLYRSDEWRIKTLAANVNQVCIIFASRPTFNPWFIWKALLAASQAGIDAVVVRNKVELAEGATEAAEAISLLKSIGEKTMEV